MGFMGRWMDMKMASAGAVLWQRVQEGLQRSEHAEANAEQLVVIESKSLTHLYEPSVRRHNTSSRTTNMRMSILKPTNSKQEGTRARQ
jgi:hypothetical protein